MKIGCLTALLAALMLPACDTQAAPTVHHAKVDGARLAYYTLGSGPALLMNMGSGSTMSEWDPPLLADLAKRHRLVLYDYRGVGRSSRVRGNQMTIEMLADDAARLLDRLDIAKADVLGWSLGGFVAQQIAIRHPQKVDRLILAATNPGSALTRFGPKWAQRVDSDPQASDAQQLSTNFPRDRAGRKAGRAFLRRLEHAVEKDKIPDDFTVPRSGYLAQLGAERRWYRSDSNARALHRIAARTLVADGRLDVLTPPINSKLIASRIRGAKLKLFRHAGHAFLFQHSRRFAIAVERFLSHSPRVR